MALQHKLKLACDLIRAHFGELVEKVCRCLVYKGPLVLPEIARYTEMNPTQLKNSILVLVQHNCIQGYKLFQEAAGPNAPKVFTSYLGLTDNILHRTRFPKFLSIVRDELGGEAEALLEGLLEHGRLTLEQVIQRAAARAGKAEAEVELPLKQTFAALVRSHYIERCPTPEPTVAPKAMEPPKKIPRGPSSKGRAAKIAAIKNAESEYDRIVSAAAALDTERFRVPSSLEEVGETGMENGDVTMADPVASGQKRKRDALAMDAKTMAVVDEKEVLWRANYEELVRKLRHQACVEQVKSRIDAAAGTVLGAMLEMTRNSETVAKPEVSAPLSMAAIMQAVTMTPEGRTMTMERIRGALHQMAQETIGFITRSGEGGSSYTINMNKIIELARRNEVEAIVLQRYGRESCRIFRLLMMKGQMEQKQVAGMAMVQLKDARELLYRLLKEQYVCVQEVAKSAEHSAQKSIYLWNINWHVIKLLVLDDMYHAAANLQQRLTHELEQEQEVLELLKQIQAAKASGVDTHVTLTQRQQEQVKRIRRVASILEASLLKLDSAILLFHDF
ncbi:hypothetical protein R1flu_020552 [Riccia fluitans]|uniref:DNA-directed RNA polymerase III subunit RPC3 n=1 Tax=Riccia fluitans TaxID=41844 RepID=A0ABD1ZLU3_9MARC